MKMLMRISEGGDAMLIILAYLILAMICSIAVTAVICLFLNLFVMPFLKEKAMEKARKEGRALEAKLGDVDYYPDYRDKNGNRYYYAHYHYTYKGKQYEYIAHFSNPPSLRWDSEKTVYFKKNPKKAKIEVDFGWIEDEWKPIYLLATIVCFVVLSFYI